MVRITALVLGVWLGWTATAHAQVITEAEYRNSTGIYPHAVLGDDEEWATLEITIRKESGEEGGLFHGTLNTTYRIEALEDMVYEDTEPRLWDVTGDGAPEVVVVMSHQTAGAQLVVIGLSDGELTYLAATPPIGTRFRWLAPVAAADLDGDGHIEVAYVDRPHLAKTLRIWRYTDDEFKEVATQPGVTNHKIGWDYIVGGLRECGETPEMVLSNASWSKVVAATFDGAKVQTRELGNYTGPESIEAALSC